VTPCSTALPPGNYSLGMADEGHKTVLVKSPLVVRRDTTVVGHYQSNAWRRVLGIVLIATSVAVAGALSAGYAATAACPSDGTCNPSTAPPLQSSRLPVHAIPRACEGRPRPRG
jgi:hypothetical protein